MCIMKYVISPQCSLSPWATGLYLSSKGNSNTTKSFLYSFKVCKNKILFFPWAWMYGTFTYPAEELNPEWIQSLSAALIKCTAPALWGFLGLIQAWPLRHARQVEAVLQSSSQRDAWRGQLSPLLTQCPEREWRTASQPWVFSTEGSAQIWGRKSQDNPGTESRTPFADLASVPFTLKCQQNCFTAGLGPWPISAGWQRCLSIREVSQDLLH